MAWARRGWVGYALAVAGVGAATAAIGLIADRVPPPAGDALYLLVVLLVASSYGRGPALVAALGAALLADFFFVGPPHRFTLADPGAISGDWATLALLLVAAMAIGQVGALTRRRADDAALRAREIGVLYDVARAMEDADRDLDGALAAAGRCLEGAFPWARGVRVRAGTPAATAAPTTLVVPICAGCEQLGCITIMPGSGPGPDAAARQLLTAVAAQVGVALERATLHRAAAEADALRRADDLKSALLAAVSHDLRTPLAAIIAAADNLQQDPALWDVEERREMAAAIEGEARRLNRLVSNLLDLSRIEAGSLRPQRGWYDPGTLVDEVLGHTRDLLARHRLAVAIPELAPLPFDYVQIAQVLVNLLENAAKYAPPGTTIGIELRDEGGAIALAVLDEGPGLPAESDRLFAPFYRAGDGAHGPHGTGLGLAVARGFVAAHGGRIWAENRPTGGARFVFTLPRPAPPRRSDDEEE